MKIKKALAMLVSLVMSAGFCQMASAKSSVWQVSDGTNTLVIGGTIHLLRKQDYPLPAEFETAYAQSQILVLETDMEKAESPEFVQLMMKSLLLPKGERLSQKLNAKTLKNLNAYLSANSLNLDNFEFFEPAGLSLVLTVTEYMKQGFEPELGVEKYFLSRKTKTPKKEMFLETPEDQLKAIESLKSIEANELIQSSLDEFENLTSMMNDSMRAWRQGDMSTIFEEMGKPLLEDSPDMYQSLLVTRNNNWLPKIKAMLKTPEKEFILVGSLHLAGPDSVLELLKKSGYTVTYFKDDQIKPLTLSIDKVK